MALGDTYVGMRCMLIFVQSLLFVGMFSAGAAALEHQAREHNLRGRLQRQPSRKYAYYIQAYKEPLMIANLLKMIRMVEPHALVFMLSDGGYDFSELANKYGVRFTLAGVNIGKYHGERFLFRLGKAMAKCDCEFMVMLEEDTCIYHPPKLTPKGDVGGVPWTDMRDFGPFDLLLKKQNRSLKPPRWGFVTGAAGGAYYRVATMMQLPELRNGTLSHEFRDLMSLMPRFEKENLLSNDIAGPALAYEAGLRVVPWDEISEGNRTFNGNGLALPTGKEAFEHDCAEQRKLAGVECFIDDTLTVPEIPSGLASLPPDGEF